MMWLQRSRITWLKEGDRNTKFFHRKAQWRAKKNRINKLKKEDGNWCHDQQEMQGMAVDYFQHLFTENATINLQDIIDLIEPAVKAQANADLCKEFSDEEIHYGKPVIRRVPKRSPCTNHQAHGEESLCRGPNTEHTAKIKHTAKGGFAVCSNLSTRRNDFFAVCHRPAHGKDSATWPDVHG